MTTQLRADPLLLFSLMAHILFLYSTICNDMPINHLNLDSSHWN